jgi:hypothetical protein
MQRAALGGTFAILLISTLHAPFARAQTEAARGLEERRSELYREGMSFARAGRWTDAVERFREVIAIRSTPKARIAVAVAEENLGRLAAAERSYLAALAGARVVGASDDESTALVALRVLSPRVPRVTLALPSGVDAIRVSVDGQPAAYDGREIAVDPGRHTLIVEAQGRRRYETAVDLEERDRKRLVVLLPTTEDRQTPSRGVSASFVGAAVVTAAGLAGAGVGIALWAAGKGREADLDADCPAKQCPDTRREELAPTIDSAHDMIVAGNVLFAIGLGTAALGGAWLAMAASSGGPAGRRSSTTVRLGLGSVQARTSF